MKHRILLLLLLAWQSAQASTPNQSAICGDWDMGSEAMALRITPKDAESLFVEYCDRDILLSQHVCDAGVILYFTFSQSSEQYIHHASGAQHLQATLRIDPRDPAAIDYSFKSDVGEGALSGKRIPQAS